MMLFTLECTHIVRCLNCCNSTFSIWGSFILFPVITPVIVSFPTVSDISIYTLPIFMFDNSHYDYNWDVMMNYGSFDLYFLGYFVTAYIFMVNVYKGFPFLLDLFDFHILGVLFVANILFFLFI